MSLDASTFDEADLNAFADGRLEPGRAAALAESLATDRQARARVDGWKRQNEALRTLFASVLFEPIPVRLMPTTLTAAGATVARTAPTKAPARAATASGGAVAMMALGVALVGFMAGVLATVATHGIGREARASRGTGEMVVSLAARAAETYQAMLADPARPRAFSGVDRTRLQGWMAQQLSGSARIPDLRPQGWSLLGGSVVPGQYAPAAFLTYGSGSGRLGLYVARAPVSAPAHTSVPGDGAVAVTTWSEHAIGYALASSGGFRPSDRDVETIRDAVSRQMNDDVASP